MPLKSLALIVRELKFKDNVENVTGEHEIYIPDWYEWQRKNVMEQINCGQYRLDVRVRVEALPNAKNFIDCGEGHICHNREGFELTFMDYETKEQTTLRMGSATLFSIHTEYDSVSMHLKKALELLWI